MAGKKILMVDNYDSFTYNLVQFLGVLGAELVVFPEDVGLPLIALGDLDIVRSSQRTDEFALRIIKRNFPRFIATILIIRDPAKYGFQLPEPYPPLAFDTVTVSQPVKLAALSAALGRDAAELSYLNPELRFESTPDRPYALRIPAGFADKIPDALAAAPRFLAPAEQTLAWHVVQSGETLTLIAARYGTTVAVLLKLNGMRDGALKAVQRLKVPVHG